MAHQVLKLAVANCPSPALALTNCVFLNPADCEKLTLTVQAVALPLQTYAVVQDRVFVFKPSDVIPVGSIGMTNIQRREADAALGQILSVFPYDPKREDVFLSSIDFEVDLLARATKASAGKKGSAGPEVTFSAQQLAASLERSFTKHFFTVGQTFVFSVNEVNLKVVVKAIQTTTVESVIGGKAGATSAAATATREGEEPVTCGCLMKGTDIRVARANGSALKLTGATSGPGSGANLFKVTNLDPEKLGIGGLDKEFMDIVRRTLVSRMFPPSFIQKLGIQHVKGIILYGPPGTGKTLMARVISKMLNGQEPVVKSGPELFNKYVGQTEENIRNLFQPAIDDYEQRGEDADLHVIVIDEIDALCKQRGSRGDGTGVGDSAVNQLLAILDGVNAVNNILLIGMTNRLDMIDEALLRPGRMEVHVEVGLPDEQGRLQILRIHTKSMSESHVLADDVDVEALAKRTKNYTGSEIAGLVKCAASYALGSQIDFSNTKDIPKNLDDVRVTGEMFERALTDVKPQYGIDEVDFSRNFINGVIEFNELVRRNITQVKNMVTQVKKSARTPLVSCLFSGPAGSGKTAFVSRMAFTSGMPFVRIISPNDLILSGSESARCSKIVSVFEEAYRCAYSVVIIDDIERILDYTAVGPRFSNAILQALLVLVKKPPPKEHRKLLVLGTTSAPDVMRELGLFDAFDFQVDIPLVTGPAEVLQCLKSLQRMDKLKSEQSNGDWEGEAMSDEMIQSLVYCFPEKAEIPVKTLLMHAERVRLAEGMRKGPAHVLSVDDADRQRLAADDRIILSLLDAAEKGDAQAQVDAGLCYLHGVGGASQDDIQAVYYFQQANDMRGWFHLGYCQATGTGMEQDEKEGFKLIEKAANAGYIPARYNLAVCCVNGIGSEKHPKTAVKYFKEAAKAGYGPAMYSYALCCADGFGMKEKNDAAALEMLNKASETYAPALARLGFAHQFGLFGLEKNATKAAELYEKAAKMGDADALFQLAVCYANGFGIERDVNHALALFCQAADQGSAAAQYALSVLPQQLKGSPLE